MKSLIFLVGILITWSASAQNYPFAQHFVPGTITLKDATQQKGFVKWWPYPNEKLRFKLNDQHEDKYAVTDLLGFATDSLQFKTLTNLQVYGEEFPIFSRMSVLKQTFAQVVYTGKINIYYVLYYGYDALQGGFVTYPNIIFEKTKEEKQEYAAFPVYIRMKEKKYEKAKQNLYPFFSEYPAILEKLKQYSRGNDIITLVEFIKTNTDD
ncbi:hypothetical protein FAM09_00530 [Niastella caeni]|uniref:Uncharacterized protein n=1 Tax=Niastella caeni TaxID=2569763 RepID=A0A4S8HYN3_9BACT|nr:hypothetical protein [Niastella caeni]THU40635.1 hypothetical protein FAM09_00530 [Niastella caeni]